MRTLGNVLVVIAAIALISFPFCYQLTTRGAWARWSMGWHLMSFMGALALVSALAVLNVAIGPLPAWVRAVAWFLVAVVSWWRLILLFVVQSRDHDDDSGDDR